jgi:hypothetical protein
MLNWFLPLLPVLLLVLAGVFVPLIYLRQAFRAGQYNKRWFYQSNNLLAALFLVALLSAGFFIFILLFNF